MMQIAAFRHLLAAGRLKHSKIEIHGLRVNAAYLLNWLFA